MTEVVVVGAGPVGLRVAKNTAKAGYNTVVLEKNSVIGKPVQCAGLVSPRVVELTDTESVIEKPKKAVINSPSGKSLTIEAKKKKAVVIDRAKFDREMTMKASKSGADIRLKSVVKNTTCDGRREVEYIREGRKETLKADVVIGADGPTSIVRRTAGLPSPEEVLPAVQAVVVSDDNPVQIHLGSKTAPGFFLYEVPFSTGKLIGLASDDGATYKHLIEFLKSKGLDNKVITLLSGTIPLGNLEKTVDERLCLVGDSACHVKPLSGGGIYLGLKAADICSDVVINALEEGDLSERRLSEYHERCQQDIGKQISRGMKIRKIIQSMSDDEINELISTLKKDKVKRVIEEKGDIDYHSKIFKPLLKTAPELLKFTGPVLKSLF
ncbi:MAG: geranylgeranyl reductase family protein [Candidatus Thermoplasmatota archaeon]|nr:geranylgeranyl reductase family protein [Candidatus Thermoplasmatota archaeon]